jgi:hypothetical protein
MVEEQAKINKMLSRGLSNRATTFVPPVTNESPRPFQIRTGFTLFRHH